MPTKAQAKTAIDNVVVAIKADIDNVLPVGVDISAGQVLFNPTKWFIVLNATTQATADSWRDTIKTNLTSAARTFTVTDQRGRRADDTGRPKFITIDTALAVYTIQGYTA